jgi:hypothetical protein
MSLLSHMNKIKDCWHLQLGLYYMNTRLRSTHLKVLAFVTCSATTHQESSPHKSFPLLPFTIISVYLIAVNRCSLRKFLSGHPRQE